MEKRKGFRASLIIIPIIILITAMVALAAVAVIRHNLSVINGSPYDFAQKYLNNIERDELITLACGYAEENISEFEALNTARAQLTSMLSNASLSISRADAYTDDSPTFTVYADGEEAFTLALKPSSSVSSGKGWSVSELYVSDNNALGSPLTVEVPKDASVVVNGFEIDPSKAVKTSYHALSEFERGSDDEICSQSYSLGKFFSSPDVIVVYNGKRLSADKAEKGFLRYSYPRSELIGVTLTVPYGSSVTINGVPLNRSYSVDSGVKYPFLTRFEENLTGLTTSVVYQVSGLFREPEIKVVYNNTELAAKEGTYIYYLPESHTQNAVILAPSYATVKINGFTVSGAEITRQNVELPILEPEKTYAKKRPYMTEYTVNGLLTDPIITAFDENGAPLEISTYYSTDDVVFFSCVRSNNMPDREKLTLRTFGREYVEYFYNGSYNLAANYKDITAMTPSGSSAYYALHDAYSSLRKAPQYKNIKVGEVSFLEYYVYSTTSYSVIMEVPFTATLDGVSYSFKVTLDVLYIYSGQIRRIVGYNVLDATFTVK